MERQFSFKFLSTYVSTEYFYIVSFRSGYVFVVTLRVFRPCGYRQSLDTVHANTGELDLLNREIMFSQRTIHQR